MTGGDDALIALSQFHAHFRATAITSQVQSSRLVPVDEVGTFICEKQCHSLVTLLSVSTHTRRFDVQLR